MNDECIIENCWRCERLPQGHARYQTWEQRFEDGQWYTDGPAKVWGIWDTQPSDKFPNISPTAIMYVAKEKKARKLCDNLNSNPKHTIGAAVAKTFGFTYGMLPEHLFKELASTKDRKGY